MTHPAKQEDSYPPLPRNPVKRPSMNKGRPVDLESTGRNPEGEGSISTVDNKQEMTKSQDVNNESLAAKADLKGLIREGLERESNSLMQPEAAAEKKTTGLQPLSNVLSALQPAVDIIPRKVDWLWSPMLAVRKFHLLAARGGSAKTSITCDISARVTTGREFPMGSAINGEKFSAGSVLFITTEDEPDDTLLPRFLAAGGDPAKLTFLSSAKHHLDINARSEELKVIIESLPDDLALIILDPVTSMTGDANTHVDSNVKRLCGVLSGIAMQHDICMLGIIHFKKGDPTGKGQSFVDMVTGSAGWVNSARIALACFVDEKTDTGYFGVIKSNIGHKKYTLEYKVDIVDEVVEIKYQNVQTTNIESIIREVSARESKESRAKERQRRAINLIGDFFTDHGLKPAVQKDARKYVKEMIGERISGDELLQAERAGFYKSKPGGKGSPWLMHPPGCECEKCAL